MLINRAPKPEWINYNLHMYYCNNLWLKRVKGNSCNLYHANENCNSCLLITHSHWNIRIIIGFRIIFKVVWLLKRTRSSISALNIFCALDCHNIYVTVPWWLHETECTKLPAPEYCFQMECFRCFLFAESKYSVGSFATTDKLINY